MVEFEWVTFGLCDELVLNLGDNFVRMELWHKLGEI